MAGLFQAADGSNFEKFVATFSAQSTLQIFKASLRDQQHNLQNMTNRRLSRR